jgi:hypothetical protein
MPKRCKFVRTPVKARRAPAGLVRAVVPAFLFTALALGGAPPAAQALAPGETAGRQVTFEGASEDFTNPERGFYIQRAFPSRGGGGTGALSPDDLRAAREKHMSLVRMLYSLREFREAPLSADLLARLDADFSRAREAGVKVIPRFSYSSAIGQPDASLERILAHIEQLKPVLRADADVIALVEAGFAGAWGEWHSSTNGLFDIGPGVSYPQANDKTRKILDKLLEALPGDRMVVLRCPRFKTGFFGAEALSVKDGFSGTPKARVGALNDCFLASQDDSGTFTDRMAEEKAFLHQDNLFVPQGGETCAAGPEAQPFISCANALKEMEYLRYSNLNADYNRNVLAVWEKGGCMAEIRRRMGYRFRLVEARLPPSVKPGAMLQMSFTVTNEGWANLHNPRPVEVILRSRETGKEYRLALAEDARLWMPAETRKVAVEGGVPAAMAAGSYDLLLHLPDAAARLKGRPEYAIRLANAGAWEPTTGMNSLGTAVKLDPTAKGLRYGGKRWFH